MVANPRVSSAPRTSPWAIAVLQLLYTESTMISGLFLKKKPPCTELNRAHEWENCSILTASLTRCAVSAAAPKRIAPSSWCAVTEEACRSNRRSFASLGMTSLSSMSAWIDRYAPAGYWPAIALTSSVTAGATLSINTACGLAAALSRSRFFSRAPALMPW